MFTHPPENFYLKMYVKLYLVFGIFLLRACHVSTTVSLLVVTFIIIEGRVSYPQALIIAEPPILTRPLTCAASRSNTRWTTHG